MSLYDKASLILIPSGAKAETVFSQKPTNGDGDFDFTRATYATRVNNQGLIEKERSNLLLQSNSFDTTWENVGSNETSGQSGYDGSNNAWLLEVTTSGLSKYVKQAVVASGIVTFSCYAKAGTTDFFRLQINGTNTAFGYFDLNNGVSGSTLNEISTNIESVGSSGWYRCSLISQNPSIVQVRIYVAASTSSISVTQGDNIYIQDAQLEQNIVATDVIQTTTSAVYEGVTDNVPRLDYSDGDCPSLLLEPQRTNLINTSNYFSGWHSDNNSTITLNSTTSPDGTVNASTLEATGTTEAYVRDRITLNESADVTFSFFAKYNTSQYIVAESSFFTGGENARVWFDIQNGNKGSSNNNDVEYDIIPYGNGWYRCTLTFNISSQGLSGYCNIKLADADGNLATTVGNSAFIFGGQAEEGSYATSYIPTYGTTVTRDNDSCSAGDSDMFNDSEGVLYTEIAALAADNADKILRINSSLSNTYIDLRIDSTPNRFQMLIKNNNINIANKVISVTNYLEFNKVAIRYKQGEVCAIYANGNKLEEAIGASLPTGLNVIQFTNSFEGKVKALYYFNEALTDQQCIDLTT